MCEPKERNHNDESIQRINREKSFLEQKFKTEISEHNKFVPFPCIKINDKEDFYFFLNEIFNLEKDGNVFLYRGQSNSDWWLESTLERELKDTEEYISYIEQKIFSDFISKLRGKLSDQSILGSANTIERNRELWAIGRHHGLKTPLLDWSSSLYVALFMAYAEPKRESEISEYSAIFMVDYGYFIEDPMYVPRYFFTPKTDYYGRITAQKGFLSDYNIRNYIKHCIAAGEQCAFKIYIKNSLRKEILDYLKHIGIEYITMYPDLLGVIKSVNNELEEILIEKSLK